MLRSGGDEASLASGVRRGACAERAVRAERLRSERSERSYSCRIC